MKKLLLALALLIVVASPVSAGCAWILWGMPSNRFFPIIGFNNKEECETERILRSRSATPDGQPQILTCFPDTFDPRGIKPSN